MTLLIARRARVPLRIVLGLLLIPAIGLSGLLATQASAAPKTMTIKLSGADEVPPVQSAGKGTAVLSYDPDTRALSWTLEFSDLSGPATMAHFHGPAMPGKNAPVALPIGKNGEVPVSPTKGEAVLTEDQAKAFAGGEWYINVHTSKNPPGEIRGLIPAVK